MVESIWLCRGMGEDFSLGLISCCCRAVEVALFPEFKPDKSPLKKSVGAGFEGCSLSPSVEELEEERFKNEFKRLKMPNLSIITPKGKEKS